MLGREPCGIPVPPSDWGMGQTLAEEADGEGRTLLRYLNFGLSGVMKQIAGVCSRGLLLLVLLLTSGCAPDRVDEELLHLPNRFRVVREFEAPNPAGGPEFVSNYLVLEPRPGSSVHELVRELRAHYEGNGITFEPSPSGRAHLFGTGRGLVSIGVMSEFVGPNASVDAETVKEGTAGLSPSGFVLVSLSPR